MTLGVVILAAGRGTRMQSNKQKILHEVGGRPMVLHVFLAAAAAADLPPVVVVAPSEPGVAELLGGGAVYVAQPEPLGTGHATQTALPFLQGRCDQVLVVNADMPLLRRETMELLARRQRESGAAVVVLSVMGDPGSAFGRIVRDSDGRFTAIVEAAEAHRRPDAAELLTVREQNVGVYCFDARWLWDHIEQLPLRQGRQRAEYYLTDLVEIAAREGKTVEAIVVDDPDEGLGAGTRAELVQVEKAFRRRATNHWLANGVSFIDPDAVYIDPDVTIGQDCVIWPNTYLQGATVIGEGCVIGPNAVLRDALVGRNCRIEQAVVENSTIPDGERVEPFSLLRGRQDAEGV